MRKPLALAAAVAAAALAVAVLGVALAAPGFDRLPGAWRARRWLGREPGYPEHRRERLEQLAREPEVADGTVVLVGSSTIERFPLERCFPGRPASNRGIGDEPLAELAERIEVTLPRGRLGGIVVYAGSVDFRRDPAAAEGIARDVDELLGRIAALRPGVPLCVVSPLPERAMSPSTAERLSELERLLRESCEARGVAFVATDRPPLRGATGLSEAHSVDRLHLNDAGYDVLARWIVEDGGPAGRALAR